MRQHLILGFGFLFFTLLGSPLQSGGMLKSGPQKGELLPKTFHPFNINGPFGKFEESGVKYQGYYHSPICEFGLRPVVLIFAQEDEGGKDAMLMKLLAEIDDVVEKDPNSALQSFVVFLSPYAQSAVTQVQFPKENQTTDPFALNAEVIYRDALIQRLDKRAANLKHVIVTTYPIQGPPDYKLSDKAEITVLLYYRHKVLANFAYGPGELNDAAITEIANEVRKEVGLKKKE